ncbi:hypothetical protein QRY07_19040 [Bacillus cereus]|uniref:hypothetical protein n=1 Tax=Bacillus cereus TaxID=1396 RepID=UPI00257017B8|nr:hypothetical protein [Bacillus cereus]WJE18829.1 hypothetical protein QRY07_19040 [Bacillus cereus]
MDALLQNIKLKKKLEYLSNLSNENQELKESVKALASTVERLQITVDNLQTELNEKVNCESILDAIVYAIEDALKTYQEEIVPCLSWGYRWYEYRHPKLRELLGEW